MLMNGKSYLVPLLTLLVAKSSDRYQIKQNSAFDQGLRLSTVAYRNCCQNAMKMGEKSPDSPKLANGLFRISKDGQVCCPPVHIQLFHTFLCNSQNYHPRGAVDNPMNCCPRPRATVHQVIRSTEGVII